MKIAVVGTGDHGRTAVFTDGPLTYHAGRRFVVHGRYALELVYDGRGSPVATFDRLCKELKVGALPR